MPGSKIPVLESEKFTVQGSGRGLYIVDDATNFDVGTWSTGVWISGNTTSGPAFPGGGSGQILPAASAAAWMRVTSDAGTAYYIPLFNYHW